MFLFPLRRARRRGLTLRSLWQYGLQGLVLCLLVSMAVILLTSQRSSLAEALARTWRYLPAMLGLVVLSWLANGARLWVMARSMGYRVGFAHMTAIGMAADFGVAASPAGAGGLAVRIAFMVRAGIPAAAVTSIQAVDFLLDAVFFALLLPVACYVAATDKNWTSHLPHLGMPATVLVGGLALGALALAGLWRYENAIIRWLGGQLQRVGPARRHRLPARLRLARRMTRRVLSDSVHSSAWLLRERRGSLAAVFVLAAIQWSCRYGVLPLLLVAYGCHRNPLPLLVLQGLIMVFSVVAVMPGGGGSVEVVSAFLLRGFVPLSAVGMVLLLWRLFTYHLYLLAGGAMFLWLVR